MKTWQRVGAVIEVIRLSSTETIDAVDTPDAPAVDENTDAVRAAMLGELTDELGDALVGSHIAVGVDITVRVAAEAWAQTAVFLKDGMGFAYFNFLSAIDWLPALGRDMDSQVDLSLERAEQLDAQDGSDAPAATDAPAAPAADAVGNASSSEAMEQGLAGGNSRFQVFARVNDVVTHRAITIKADVDEVSLTVPSWVPVYAGANWHEREAWEMFGIQFEGHPGLRHIYLPGAFEGYPLRKDYPLLARRIKPWPGIVDVELMPTDDAEVDR